MFALEIYDRIGNKLKLGDIVKISNGREFTYYAEVKYLEKEKMLAPFHTFSFHSIVKVDNLPSNAKKTKEERYNSWYTHPPEIDDRVAAKHAEQYLTDWLHCEYLIDRKYFRIEIL